MNKKYIAPDFDTVRFTLADVILASNNFETENNYDENGNIIGDLIEDEGDGL